MAKRRHYKGYIHTEQLRKYLEFYIDNLTERNSAYDDGKMAAFVTMHTDLINGRLERGE